MSQRCILCYVSGHVQGVFFRGSAQEEALRVGVRGYAENLRDGRVRVLACGSEEALEAFHAWLEKGPRAARVEAVHCEDVDVEPPSGFDVR
ncbi:acylphosphatase [Aquisalimonas lutea]|uniref:acylphosphatase n=1 Tax=Aquisalimonas lutea TaxID=1327750 RepID=UPI0025B60EBC|nr:acylphosphatase [Aquisalimonas lutea]MDN3519230.1 acylphosphatase [Aquisalimonas lutea]